MPTENLYAVDRIEREQAVLVGDDGDEVLVPLSNLSTHVREGSVLRVRVGQSGELNWPEARIDDEETARRQKEAEEVLRELRKRDPGGDVQL
ncbi:MAG: DUF3006 domain-containing protein [Gemmatimonadota bacterium]|nr:MAG: DUF3006 domain-containing protein [Gemmatimonadota bacterium]